MRFAPGLPAGVLNSAEALVTADHISYTRYVSEETGWTYFITSPANLYFTDNLSTIGFLGGVFAVYLLLGLFLVRRIARRSYRPVKDINDLILQSAPGGAGDDEFAVIKSTLLNQMRSGTELQRIIEAQRPAVVRDLLLQLLLGQTLDWDGARSQLEALGVRFGGDAYIAVLAEADLDSAFFLDSNIPLENNLSVARLVLQNVGCELFGANAACQYLDLGRAQGVFLLSPPSGENDAAALAAASRQGDALARFCAQQFELDIFVGVSAMEQGLEQLPLCYDEARKALEYSRLQAGGGTEPVLFTALDVTHSDYYYPLEAEQQLLQYVRAGDAAKAQEVLEKAQAGEDFNALMEEYNEDPGEPEEGYYFPTGVMVQEFEDASFALQDGEISDIVETSYGYHIIKRLPLDESYIDTHLLDLAADSSVNEQMQQDMDERIRAGEIWYCDVYDQISPATLF